MLSYVRDLKFYQNIDSNISTYRSTWTYATFFATKTHAQTVGSVYLSSPKDSGVNVPKVSRDPSARRPLEAYRTVATSGCQRFLSFRRGIYRLSLRPRNLTDCCSSMALLLLVSIKVYINKYLFFILQD